MATRDISTRLLIDGEAEFKAAMNGAYSEMKVLGSELKLASAEFKSSGDAQEYMRARSETLRKEIEQQKGIVAALEQAVADATTKYGEGSPKVDEYQVKLNNAKAALSNMEAQLSNTEQGLDDSGKALGATGEKTDELKDKSSGLADMLKVRLIADALKGFTDGLRNVISSIKDTLTAVWDLAEGAGEFADELVTTSIQTGISAKSLQEWSYAARFVDTEVDTVTSSMVKMIRSMTSNSKDTQDAWKALGVSVADTNGHLRDSETVFWEAIDALGEVSNATERDSIAMQLFGKSAQDLNPLITAGSDTWKAYCDEAEAAGLVLSEDAVGSLGEFDDTMQKVDATVGALKNNFIVAFLPAFQSVADALATVAGKVNEWLQTEEAQEMIGNISEKVSEFASNLGENLGGAISAVIEAVTWIGDNIPIIIGIVVSAMAGFTASKIASTAASIAAAAAEQGLTIAQYALNAAMSVNPIGLIVTGIGLLIPGIVELVSWIGDLISSANSSTDSIEDWAKSIVTFDSTLNSTKANVADMNSILSSHGRTLGEINAIMQDTETSITDILKTAIGEQRALREDELESIRVYNDKLMALQQEKLQMYQDQMAAEIIKLNQGMESLTQEQAAQRIRNMEAYIKDANELADKGYSQQITIIENKYRAMGLIGSEAYRSELQAATDFYNAQVNINESYMAELISDVAQGASRWVSTDADKWAQLNDGTRRNKKEYSALLNEIDADNTEAFLSMYLTAVSMGADISDESRALASNILNAFDNLPGGLKDQGKDALLGLIAGIQGQIPGLEDTSKMSAEEIIGVLRSTLDISSPSRVMREIGGFVVDGLRSGISENTDPLNATVRDLASGAINSLEGGLGGTGGIGRSMVEGLWGGISASVEWIKTKLTNWIGDVMGFIKGLFGINSPSTLFRDEIGFQLGAGMAEGITKSTALVRRAIDNMANSITPTVNGRVSVNYKTDASASISKLSSAMQDRISALERSNQTIILQLNDRELGRAVRGYV